MVADSSAAAWLDRVVGLRRADPRDLSPHPQNPRIHTDAGRAALRGVIGDVGFLIPVVWNVRTNRLLDGHERVEEALASGQEAVPVVDVDLPEELEPEALLTINALAALAELDRRQADALREAVVTDDAAVLALIASDDAAARSEPDPPLEFREYGEGIETSHRCPKCGYEWS